ncbi:dockerin type I domain-containing protein [Acetivibrio cellulolyticus]|uniref:dockerin type I domain-containing protein n=1 Tax=Acetivibrio cellulolyticus TaxID=35830 RepID=UPI0001E2D086|nr:dockerin type I domain-containing protein [Acetivibrio cellulolyticus]
MKHFKNRLLRFMVLPTLCLSLLTPQVNVMAEDSILYGDVTADSKVDSADYTKLRSYLIRNISSLPNPQAADVNLDGKIDSADFTLLRKYLLKEIASLPYVRKTLDVPLCIQETNCWCWAATTQAIIAYYTDSMPSQESIVRNTLKIPNDQPLSYYNLNRPVEDIEDLISLEFNGISGHLVDINLDWYDLKKEIDAGRPIKATIENDPPTSMAHCVLIYGYIDSPELQKVLYMDPDQWNGGKRESTREDFYRRWTCWAIAGISKK